MVMQEGAAKLVRACESDFPVFERLACSAMAAHFDLHRTAWSSSIFHAGFRETENYCIAREGSVVGVLRLAKKQDHIYVFDLHVEPELRGQGIGTAVLRQIGDLAVQAGKHYVRLCAYQSNPAIQLYRRLGYEAVKANDILVQLERRVS